MQPRVGRSRRHGTLAFRCRRRRSLTVEGEASTGAVEITPNELSAAIIAAVADEHSLATDDGVTRVPR